MPKPTALKHVAIIMDGNRRWAKTKGLGAGVGHEKVAKEGIKALVKRSIHHGITHLTLWAWSPENWQRSLAEVTFIMNLFRKSLIGNIDELFKVDVKVETIGDLSRFPQDIQDSLADIKHKSAQNKAITVIFALSYGGHDELIRAFKAMASQPDFNPKQLSEKSIAAALDTAKFPHPDLIIRPGGEQRLSGFMSWQSSYAELYFTDVLMPDFGPDELDEAVKEYAQRSRRFGS